jgi:hypothetical protein
MTSPTTPTAPDADPEQQPTVTELARRIVAGAAPDGPRRFDTVRDIYLANPREAVRPRPRDEPGGFGFEFVVGAVSAVLLQVLSELGADVVKDVGKRLKKAAEKRGWWRSPPRRRSGRARRAAELEQRIRLPLPRAQADQVALRFAELSRQAGVPEDELLRAQEQLLIALTGEKPGQAAPDGR